MSKMIQIRNVPDEVHRTLQAGMNLSDYLRQEVTRLAERPTLEEWFEEVRKLEPVEPDEDAVVTIRG